VAQAPYLPQCGAISTTPHAMRLHALPDREQYAALELWRGTMATHSVVVRRSDGDGRPSGWGKPETGVPVISVSQGPP
jgi:hypothetical protein